MSDLHVFRSVFILYDRWLPFLFSAKDVIESTTEKEVVLSVLCHSLRWEQIMLPSFTHSLLHSLIHSFTHSKTWGPLMSTCSHEVRVYELEKSDEDRFLEKK